MFLHDGDETAEGLEVESGGDGDPTSLGKDEFEVGSEDGDRQDGIGNESDVDDDEETTGGGIKRQAARCLAGEAIEARADRPVWWRDQRGPRCSVQTWAFLHDGDETAEGLGVESGGDGDPTSLGKDEFEVGSGGGGRQDRIGNDGDREEVVIGTGGRTIVAGGGLGWARRIEVLSKGVKRDLARRQNSA